MNITIHSAVIDNVRPVSVTIEARRGGGGCTGLSIRRADFKNRLDQDLEFFRESCIRVRSALGRVGLDAFNAEVTVAFEGGYEPRRSQCIGLDLPIAMAVAGVARGVGYDGGAMAFGELGLGGQIRAVRGAFAVAELVQKRGKIAIMHADGWMPSYYRATSLEQVLNGGPLPLMMDRAEEPRSAIPDGSDFADIKVSPENLRRIKAAIVAGLGITLAGKRGTGRMLLARGLVRLLPALTGQDLRDLRRVYDIAGLQFAGDHPFRAPHHTASTAAFTGRGSAPAADRPGECALAHRGVLFLDELPEFHRGTLDQLRGTLASTIQPTNEAPNCPAIVVAALGESEHPSSLQRIERFRAEHCPVWVHLQQPAAGDTRVTTSEIRAEIETAKARSTEMSEEVLYDAPQGGNRLFERTVCLASALARLEQAPQILNKHMHEALRFLQSPFSS